MSEIERLTSKQEMIDMLQEMCNKDFDSETMHTIVTPWNEKHSYPYRFDVTESVYLPWWARDYIALIIRYLADGIAEEWDEDSDEYAGTVGVEGDEQ